MLLQFHFCFINNCIFDCQQHNNIVLTQTATMNKILKTKPILPYILYVFQKLLLLNAFIYLFFVVVCCKKRQKMNKKLQKENSNCKYLIECVEHKHQIILHGSSFPDQLYLSECLSHCRLMFLYICLFVQCLS